MSFSISIDEPGHLIRISLHGRVQPADLLDLSKQLRSEAALIAGWPILYDCSAVTEILVSAELIRSLALAARQDKNYLAFVAPSPTAFGLARMYQILSDAASRVAVFPTLELAAAWLRDASGTSA